MAIVSPNASDQLDAALAAGFTYPISKLAGTAKAAGTFQSLWKNTGLPLSGANPPTGAGGIPDRNTTGAIPLPVFGTKTGYLAKLNLVSSSISTFFIGDRLWACSGLNGTLLTAQTINGANINRNVGLPNLLFIEWYTVTGSTAATITINYTNLAGTAKVYTGSFVQSPTAWQMAWVPISDTGVQSVQSVTLSASTGTAGDFGLTIVSQIETIPFTITNVGIRNGVYDMALPVIDPSACLFFYTLCNSTVQGQLNGNVSVALG